MVAAIAAAAKDLMADVCGDEPDRCDCRENRMTPLEVADWIQREVIIANGRPVRFEPAGRPRRRQDDFHSELTLASAI